MTTSPTKPGLHDFDRRGYFSEAGAHRGQRDVLASAHWLYLALACGGAEVHVATGLDWKDFHTGACRWCGYSPCMCDQQ